MPSPSSLHTSHSALDRTLVPYRLRTKAKALGTWDRTDIDFGPFAADWQALSDREPDLLLRLTAQFEGGEESVLPLVLAPIQETLSVYDNAIPFGVSVDQFLAVGRG